jgi:polyphosphate glucokinase
MTSINPPASTAVIGVDIGGTGIKGAPVSIEQGALIKERIRLLTPSPATPEAVATTVAELLTQIDSPGPVGLTLPAVVRNGVVETAANIDTGWIGTNAVDLFATATGRPVGVVNDADAAGLAETRFGAGKDRRGVVVMVTLGTGIGSAVFSNGALVPNTELGHLPLHGGDAEEWAAGLLRAPREAAVAGPHHRRRRRLEEGRQVPAPHRAEHRDRPRCDAQRRRHRGRRALRAELSAHD